MMKRQIATIILSLALLTVLTACDMEHVSNGALDGFWHLEEIDTLATGGTLSLRDAVLFWAFDANLMHTQGGSNNFYFRFTYNGTTLILHDPYLDHGHQDKEDGGDIPLTDATLLHPYGIQSLCDTFAVERLHGGQMTLRGTEHRLLFTRF